MRLKYVARFEKLLRRPQAQEVLAILRRYGRDCVPIPRKTERQGGASHSFFFGWSAITFRRGQLVTVLDDMSGGEMPINILWPRNQMLPARVRVVIDELVQDAHRYVGSAPNKRG